MRISKVITFILIFLIIITLVVVSLASRNKAMEYYGLAESYGKRFNVDIYVVLATISVESKGNKDAVSKKGARGLMQIMPSTAKWLASEFLDLEYGDEMLFDPEYNIMLGTAYLAYLSEKFEGEYVYAAYNAGESTVREWLNAGGEIKYSETQAYVNRVNNEINRLKKQYYLY